MNSLNPSSIKGATGPGDQWGTPFPLFEEIRQKYLGDGTVVDPTPNPERMLPNAVSVRDGAFGFDWGSRFFCNPPFSNIAPFIAHAMSNPFRGVFLLPVRADQKWWHLYGSQARIVFLRGRVNYVDASAPTERKSGASFASCLWIVGSAPGVEYWWPESHQRRKNA